MHVCVLIKNVKQNRGNASLFVTMMRIFTMKALGQENYYEGTWTREKHQRDHQIRKKTRSQNNKIFISSWYAKVVFFGFEGGGPILNVKKFPSP